MRSVNFTDKTKRHRLKKTFSFLLTDIVIVVASMLLSFLLRFDGTIPALYEPSIPFYVALSLALTIPLLFWRRLYAFTWAFISLDEIIEVLKVATTSGLLFFAAYAIFQGYPFFRSFPRSIIIIHHALLFLFLGFLRAAKRALLIIKPRREENQMKHTLIIGAGESADELIRIMQRSKNGHKRNGYAIMGILDDTPEKQKTLLHGVDVLGPIDALPMVASKYEIQTIVIALSESESNAIRKTITLAKKAKISDIKIIPSVYEVLDSKLSVDQLRPVRVEDLLGREPTKIETQAIESFLHNKRILITGAAGSIGSELCRQIAKFSPRALHIVDYEESNLFNLARVLELEYPHLAIVPSIADVKNRVKMETLIEQAKPHTIFHAAAYKHVPLMETFPEEAVATNAFGTLCVAKAALKAHVEKFVLISTDKAVHPVSVMGKTKKLAEMIIGSLNGQGKTHFVSVRFGNVLGSRGSVLPIFEEQIKRRLPLTITHPKMTRFFMTAPEAALLVLEAATLGEGGEIFVLDMGKPVKIIDFAKEFIRLYGLEPNKDIPIVYGKPRPGERISEILLTNEEGVSATRYQKIFRAKSNHKIGRKELFLRLKHLKTCLSDSELLKKELTKIVES